MLLDSSAEDGPVQEPVAEGLMLEGYATYASASIHIPSAHGNTQLLRHCEVTPPLTQQLPEWNGGCIVEWNVDTH